MSDAVETEESGLLLVSRNKLFNSKILMMPLLWILIDVGRLEQLDCGDIQPDDECVSDNYINERISTNEHPRPSTLDDQLSS